MPWRNCTGSPLYYIQYLLNCRQLTCCYIIILSLNVGYCKTWLITVIFVAIQAIKKNNKHLCYETNFTN
jgi:inner membrane protein involved in colicin E2 resistance